MAAEGRRSARPKALGGAQGGFTMVEVLLVVAVLALLAGIVVVVLDDATGDADHAACQAELDTVVAAIHAATSGHEAAPGDSTPADHLDGTTRFYGWSGPPGEWNPVAIGAIPFGC